MNRIAVFLASLCFLVSSSGIRISSHWCEDELVDIDFFASAAPELTTAQADDDCLCQEEDSGCCSDARAGNVISDPGKNVLRKFRLNSVSGSLSLAVPAFHPDYKIIPGNAHSTGISGKGAILDIPIYLVHSTFRI